MPTRAEVQAWVAQRVQQDDLLYARYGVALEQDHLGEFVAISDDGRILTGSDEVELTAMALERFGPGNFALRRIGFDANIRWRQRLTVEP